MVVAVCGSYSSAQDTAGFLLDKQGEWTVGEKSLRLYKGQSLSGGALLTNAAPTEGDYAVVADLRGEIIKTIHCHYGVCRECRESGTCYDPIQPLPVLKSPSQVATAAKAVFELFAAKPDRYSVHRVRGSGSGLEKNGVARLDGYTVDITYFLKDQEKGAYQVHFVSLRENENGKRVFAPISESVEWSANKKAEIVVEGIQPGLYNIQIRHGGRQSSGWILLCSPAAYPTAATYFQKFVRQTDSWESEVTDSTKQAYQRAYLEYLSSQAGTKQ